MNILLVHGFFDTGKLFRRMEKILTDAGHICYAPSLSPRDGRLGLADLAQKLSELADKKFPAPVPLVVIGFSMGALVSQFYLRHLAAHRDVRAFVAISGPLRGTWTAWLYPGRGARDMRPGSQFLRELAAAGEIKKIPVYVYFTPLDLMILPATSSRLAGAEEFCVWTPLHRGMLSNKKVAADILEKIKRLERAE